MIFHTLLLFRQFIVGGCYDGTIYCNPHVGAEFINGMINGTEDEHLNAFVNSVQND